MGQVLCVGENPHQDLLVRGGRYGSRDKVDNGPSLAGLDAQKSKSLERWGRSEALLLGAAVLATWRQRLITERSTWASSAGANLAT